MLSCEFRSTIRTQPPRAQNNWVFDFILQGRCQFFVRSKALALFSSQVLIALDSIASIVLINARPTGSRISAPVISGLSAGV